MNAYKLFLVSTHANAIYRLLLHTPLFALAPPPSLCIYPSVYLPLENAHIHFSYIGTEFVVQLNVKLKPGSRLHRTKSIFKYVEWVNIYIQIGFRVSECPCIWMKWNVLYNTLELYSVFLYIFILFNKHETFRAAATTTRERAADGAIKSAYFMPTCCWSDFCLRTHITHDYVLNTCLVMHLKLQRVENIP